ncbi:MAG: hypothetical protein EBU84_00345 [Actinobacteria bacterium]|nr:hypothetical protein [Actinomycetota bacterium]
MNSFNESFVTELTKIAQSGSSTSNLAKLLALGGLGYGGYKMYQANQANQAAAAAQAARSARNKRLLGLGLGAGALGAAHHFGLDSSILEKLKGLFGGGAAEAAAAKAAPAAAQAAAAVPVAEAANPLVSAAKGGSKLFSAILDRAKAGHFTSPNYAEMPAVPKAIQLGADGIKYHGETGDVFFPQKGLNPGQAGIPGMSQYAYGADPSNPMMPSETQIEAGNKFLLNPKTPLTSDSRLLQYERLTNPGLMGALKNLFGVRPEAIVR